MSKNHVGEIAGIFEIVECMDYKDDDGHALYKGICKECGFKRIARLYDLRYPKECTHIRIDGEVGIHHVEWDNARIGLIFNGMKKRCYSPNEKSYRWYGAKGIKVCDEWMNDPKSFEDWALANGYDDNLTIDRIKENLDYSPDNCRWVTQNDNAKYKSTTSNIVIDGVIHSGKDWARILGVGVNLVNTYVRQYGMDNTIEFIKWHLKNNDKKPKRSQSYYDLYLNEINAV